MRRTITKRTTMLVLVALVAPLLALTAAAPASAQGACVIDAQYQGSATFTASVTSVAPGGTVVFTGTGWPGNSTVTISVNGTVAGDATTNATGEFTFNYVVPATTAPGALDASAGCGTFVLTQAVTVVGGATTSTGGISPTSVVNGNLPLTGSRSLVGAQVAVALLAVGGILVLIARRREHAARS